MRQTLDLWERGAEFQNCMKQYLQYAMAKVKTLDLWEFALFKICLVSFGVWLGTVFSRTMKKLRPLFLIAFLGTCIYLVWRIFCCTKE